jgi:LysR family glycine cleavage system transcriptional activator
MKRLLPLNALRAFESLARHGTLTRASEELLVTPTAVGRHIRNLEDLLGTELVTRGTGPLVLTARGRTYARALSRAFELMGDATDQLAASVDRIPVSFRAYTTFLVKWLIPRLPDLQLRYPEVELHLTTASDPVDFDRDNVDLGLRYGDGMWPGVDAMLLFRDDLVVVGNAAARDRLAGRAWPEAIASETLLVHTLRLDDWPDWLAAAGAGDVECVRRLAFDDLALIYQAALDGLGIALCHRAYLERDLAEGRLYPLSPVALQRDRGLHLVCRAGQAQRPGIRAFRAWAAEQVAPLEPTGVIALHQRRRAVL